MKKLIYKNGKRYDELANVSVALDIGTSTISAMLVNTFSGSPIDKIIELNEQRLFGADVLSRINAAKKGKTEKLFNLINRQTQKILETFIYKWNIEKIEHLSVSGNTVMLHLFLNTDPSSMGQMPFNPVFLDEMKIKGKQLNLICDKVSVLPCIGAFIGADITSALAALDVLKKNTISLLVDIGTNCEIALVKKGKIFCCSAAAGPAFEGSIIKHGSELIDTVALLLKYNKIDVTGCLDDLKKSIITPGGIEITDKDIRDFQLAKSAVISGINILCNKAEIEKNEIKNVFITGIFGNNINIPNAITTGLFPKEFLDSISVCENLSLKGSLCNITDINFLQKCKLVKERCIVINLAQEPSFSDEFMKNLVFPN